MDSYQYDFLCVSLGGSLYGFSPAWLLVSEDEVLVLQSTGIWIVLRMTLHVSLYMVPGDETLATQRTVLCIFCMFLSRCSWR